MGIFIGIGNYVGNNKIVLNKDIEDLFSNIITEYNTAILTEDRNLILREDPILYLIANSTLIDNNTKIFNGFLSELGNDYLITNKLKIRNE